MQHRLQREFLFYLQHCSLADLVRRWRAAGLLSEALPCIHALDGCTQPPAYHDEGDVLDHTLLVLDAARPNRLAQLACLFHDVGKPSCRTEQDGKIQFLGHEQAGGPVARACMVELGLGTETQDQVVQLIQNHMRPHHAHKWKKPGLRRFCRDVGDLLEQQLDLADADAAAGLGPDGNPAKPNTTALRARIHELQQEKPPAAGPKLPLGGHDVMRVLGLEPGPRVGVVLRWLAEQPGVETMSGEEAEKLICRLDNKMY